MVRRRLDFWPPYFLSKPWNMKKLLFILALAVSASVSAQLKVKTACPEFYVDILDGKVNGLKPNAMME